MNSSSEGRPAYRQSEEAVPEPRSTSVAQQPAARQAESTTKTLSPKRQPVVAWGIVTLLFLAIAMLAVWFVSNHTEKSATGIDKNKYQAVFLSNGQHYFGKLERMNDDYFVLNDVYYLEQKSGSSETATTTAQNTTEVELRKLGEKEVHGPEDTMIISKQQVLLYENLTDKSQVVKSIDQHKQQAN